MNTKPTRITEELQQVRTIFNSNLARQLGVEAFPKNKSDIILAKAITESNILNMNIDIKKTNKRGKLFDIQF